MKEKTVACNCMNGMDWDYDVDTGKVIRSVCTTCNGTGFKTVRVYPKKVPCGNCKGTGRVWYPIIIGGPDLPHTCPDCKGRRTEMAYAD